MGKVSRDIRIDASPDVVWKVVGDLGGISKWLPAIETSSIDGDVRICGVAGGGQLTEKILEVNEDARTYSYTITDSPFPMDSHRASMSVEADGEGAKVNWTMEIEPDAVAEGMDQVADSGLNALKDHVEA